MYSREALLDAVNELRIQGTRFMQCQQPSRALDTYATCLSMLGAGGLGEPLRAARGISQPIKNLAKTLSAEGRLMAANLLLQSGEVRLAMAENEDATEAHQGAAAARLVDSLPFPSQPSYCRMCTSLECPPALVCEAHFAQDSEFVCPAGIPAGENLSTRVRTGYEWLR